MADEQNLINDKLYYDMLDEAASIDGVLHDLIGTLREENLNKAIFVTKEYINEDEDVEVKFHLTAKSIGQTTDTIINSGDEDEILLGSENNKIKGSGAYIKRIDNTLNELFNSDTIVLDGNKSYVSFNPVQFVFNFKQETDEEGNLINPLIRSSFLINPGACIVSGTYSGGSFSSTINSNSIIINNTEEKRLEIDPQHIYFRGGGNPWSSSVFHSNTIDMRRKSKFFMSSDVYPFSSSTISPDLSNNPYNFNTYIKDGNAGAQLLIDDCGSAFIRGKAILYMDSFDQEEEKLPSNYNGFYTRHESYLNQGSTNGPVIAAQGNPFVYFSGSPIFNVRNNARVMIDGNSRLTMHGRPKIDITGQDSGSLKLSQDFDYDSDENSNSPNIFIHDRVRINIDNGYTNGNYNYIGSSRANYNNGEAIIYIHDKATIDMSGGCWLKMSDTALIEGTGNATLKITDEATLNMSGKSNLNMRAGSTFLLDDNVLLRMTSIRESSNDTISTNCINPVFNMMGAAYFCMQSNNDNYGPLLVAEDKALYFLGNGMDWINNNPTDNFRWNCPMNWGVKIKNRLSSFNNIIDYWKNKTLVYNSSDFSSPCVKIGGYVTLNLDSQNPGGVYVKMGNPDNAKDDRGFWKVNVFLEGDTYIKTGEHNHVELNGGWLQTTGNPHTEIHNNTRFVFRGQLKTGVPWLDGLQFEKGIMLEDETIKWNSYNSSRSVKPVDSPVIQMYDIPNFCMRGVWKGENEEYQKEYDYAFIPETNEKTTEEILNEFVYLINEERSKEGEDKLYIEPYLIECANIRAVELEEKEQAYVRPDGSSWETVIDYEKIPYGSATPISLIGTDINTATKALSSLRSNSSRWNLVLSSFYTHIGIGIYYSQTKNKWYWALILTGDAESNVSHIGQYIPTINDIGVNLSDEIKGMEQQVEITNFSEKLKNYLIEYIGNEIFSTFEEYIDGENVITTIKNKDIENIQNIISFKVIKKNSYNEYELSNIKYTAISEKPLNWTDRAIKIENNPVLEIIENADVRVSGDVVFNIDNSGLTIGNNEKTINFTFEQLEQLKELLS